MFELKYGVNVRTLNKAVIVGVVSRGNGCARKNSPGIYARIKIVLRWIKTITKEGKCYSALKTKWKYQFAYVIETRYQIKALKKLIACIT